MKGNRVIWSIDPFEESLRMDRSTLMNLSEWVWRNGMEIEPVYVLTGSHSDAKEVSEIENRIEEFFKQICVKITRPAVLINSSRSVAKGAQCVVDHAKNSGANLIVVSSHGRTGLERMRFGSFAEALLTLSPVPVFFVNQKERVAPPARHKTLWPTDFSEHSLESFKDFLNQAGDLTSEIIVFHDLSYITEFFVNSSAAGVPFPVSQSLIDEQKALADKYSEQWLKLAKAKGLEGRYVVGMGTFAQLANSILHIARTNEVSLVAMSSHRGPLGAALFAGESYRVFRSGEFPAWIYGPESVALSKEADNETQQMGSRYQQL